ncbi:MAG TPA: dihydrofolate reductase family protein [Elusimicrobiota bacterium]|nr:dihydrofolate reductase family protein [Elusimicrobiota bacterium]
MAKIVYYVASSLDGFIARPNGDISWLRPFEGTGEDYGYREFYDSVERLVLGARTYEQIPSLGAWPYSGKPVHVVTSRPLPRFDPRVVFQSGDFQKWVPPLRRVSEKNIWLVGGGALAGAFLQEDFLDELIVSVVPVLLGEGIRLFGSLKTAVSLRLMRTQEFENGVMQMRYRVRGKD